MSTMTATAACVSQTARPVTEPGAANRVEMGGSLVVRDLLRYSPAGIPILSLRIAHASLQREAGIERCVSAEIPAVAAGDAAQALNQVPLGSAIVVGGFLAPRTARSKNLLLHVTDFKQIEV